MLMPCILVGYFLTYFVGTFLFARFVRGQLSWAVLLAYVPHIVSIILLIFYLSYLSVTKVRVGGSLVVVALHGRYS